MQTSTEPIALKEMSPNQVTQADLKRFPGMTGWFEPILLAKLLGRVIVSDVFGQYADRRLIEAALDTVPKEELFKRAKIPALTPDAEGAVWIDYVSDLGDGFDATYAIAYLLAQPSLDVGGDKALPRGQVLVMGGDEVYPTALRDDYKVKMRLPYALALPDEQGAKEIPLFLLPGNHDWYDGLVNFLAIFCREKPLAVGRWRTNQRRSYFAARLAENWWLWGIDIALVHDMDQPQADYFVGIAAAMPKRANIILCSAEPGWYKAESKGDSYRTLSYAAGIAKNAGKTEPGKELKIPLILSGDSHHYARYEGSGAQYITSGGGGAFLHGTLELKDSIDAEWLWERHQTLRLRGCYPSKQESRALLSGNRRFGRLNANLALSIGAFYLAAVFLITLIPRVDVGICIYLLLAFSLWFYTAYQEGKSSAKVFGVSAGQAAAHMTVIVGFSALAVWIAPRVAAAWPWLRLFVGAEAYWLGWLAVLAVFVLTIGSWIGGAIFGWSLLLTCRYCDLNHNDAFSAMKLGSHRHFVRIRIQGDTLTVYPIKLEKVPKRSAWKTNPNPGSHSPSRFVAPLEHGLIENPVVIDARMAPSASDIKTPGELPSQTPR